MRKITVEVPDKRCIGCDYLIHVPPETVPDDYVCSLFNEEPIIDYGPCPQCIAAGQTKYLLIHMVGGIPRHVNLVSNPAEAEAVIKNYNHGFLPEDADVKGQMGTEWGRVDIDGESEVYILPFSDVTDGD